MQFAQCVALPAHASGMAWLPNGVRVVKLTGMKIRGLRLRLRLHLVGAALAAALCASAAAQGPASQAPLRVFDATELTPDRYTVIKRIWVESWRSAFWIPAHHDSAAAIAALSAEAVRVGADAVTNLVCLDDRRAWLDPGYFCYGLAVKLKY